MVCEAWTMECETVLHKIKIKKYSNSRRHGLKPQSTPFTVIFIHFYHYYYYLILSLFEFIFIIIIRNPHQL